MRADNNSVTANNSRFPDLQQPLQEALRETDPQKLQQRVFSLEEAIVRRTEFFADTPDEGEKDAIRDALRILRTLQVEKLNYPDWNKNKPRTQPAPAS